MGHGSEQEAQSGGVSTARGEGKPLPAGITWRSVVLGTVLIPPNAYWVMMAEAIYHRGHPSVMALPWAVVFNILVLVIVNQFLKRYLPRRAFTQPELITVYVMVWIAVMLAGHDSLQLCVPALAFTTYYANPVNNWDAVFNSRLPKWATVQNKEAVASFFTGYDSFYRWEYVSAWLGPVLWWTAFIIALGVVTICVNILLRKQWAENERLSFPIVQLPLAITKDGGSGAFWRNRLLWIGIAAGGGLDLINGLHMLYPSVPYIPVRLTDHILLTKDSGLYPWNGLGWIGVPLYPFITAVGYLLPLDMSFSIWFFYIFRKLQNVLLTVYPVAANPSPYLAIQSFGAWTVYFAGALWTARPHLRRVWLRITNRPGGEDDSQEPVSYRVALLGVLAGMAFLLWFTTRMGMSGFVALAIFGFYFVVTIAITRMRAELGPPAHEMAGMDSVMILSVAAGSRLLGPANLALMPLFYWFAGRGYRTNIGPGQLEGFKMAHESRSSPRRLGWAMLIAFAVGALAAFWASLALQYSQPAQSPQVWSQVQEGWHQWRNAENRMLNPTGPDRVGVLFLLGSMVFAALLFVMRGAFTWWPFHPAGYALSMANGVDYFWTCMVIASAVKLVVLRYGGLRLYRRFLPLAFGVIIGEYLIGAMWSALSVGIGQFIYDFSPG